jgi:hypothetical protein
MYARLHIYEDGLHVPLCKYTSAEIDMLCPAITNLTYTYDIDMNNGNILDINNSFYDKFHDPDIIHRIYPRYGWIGINVGISFDILFNDEESNYMSEDDNDSYS